MNNNRIMAKLIFNTPHLIQLSENDNSIFSLEKPVYIYNDEVFSARVENGVLIVNGDKKDHACIGIEYVSFYEEVNLLCQFQSTQLRNIDIIEYDISDNVIDVSEIKYRLIKPYGVFDLSEIEYKGKRFKGKRGALETI